MNRFRILLFNLWRYRLVCTGAGAAAIACLDLLCDLGGAL